MSNSGGRGRSATLPGNYCILIVKIIFYLYNFITLLTLFYLAWMTSDEEVKKESKRSESPRINRHRSDSRDDKFKDRSASPPRMYVFLFYMYLLLKNYKIDLSPLFIVEITVGVLRLRKRKEEVFHLVGIFNN